MNTCSVEIILTLVFDTKNPTSSFAMVHSNPASAAEYARLQGASEEIADAIRLWGDRAYTWQNGDSVVRSMRKRVDLQVFAN